MHYYTDIHYTPPRLWILVIVPGNCSFSSLVSTLNILSQFKYARKEYLKQLIFFVFDHTRRQRTYERLKRILETFLWQRSNTKRNLTPPRHVYVTDLYHSTPCFQNPHKHTTVSKYNCSLFFRVGRVLYTTSIVFKSLQVHIYRVISRKVNTTASFSADEALVWHSRNPRLVLNYSYEKIKSQIKQRILMTESDALPQDNTARTGYESHFDIICTYLHNPAGIPTVNPSSSVGQKYSMNCE